ncbi:MAG: hypothetical protein QNJ77_01775 [Acidimicrobiia bacterium]|nr:hypothetical protein [Acidimicrobiia bacterium]
MTALRTAAEIATGGLDAIGAVFFRSRRAVGNLSPAAIQIALALTR